MEDVINERLKVLMEALGTNPAALSKVLGVSDSTVRNYIYRDTKPGYDILEKLYRSFRHINLPWLFGDPGEPLLSGLPNTTTNTARIKNNSGIGINNGQATIKLEDCQRELVASQKEVEHLKEQLAMKDNMLDLKDGLIAAKEELLMLLRSKYNRPN